MKTVTTSSTIRATELSCAFASVLEATLIKLVQDKKSQWSEAFLGDCAVLGRISSAS